MFGDMLRPGCPPLSLQPLSYLARVGRQAWAGWSPGGIDLSLGLEHAVDVAEQMLFASDPRDNALAQELGDVQIVVNSGTSRSA